MNIRKVLTAVTATAVFLCSSIFVQADYSDEYATEDYREQAVYNSYGEVIEKPIANFRIIRMRNGEIKDIELFSIKFPCSSAKPYFIAVPPMSMQIYFCFSIISPFFAINLS